MPIHYHLVPRHNLQDLAAAPRYYAVAKAMGELTLEDLAEKIAQSSTTVSDTDVLAVLNEAAKLVETELLAGNIVRFGRLGSFTVALSSEGSETTANYTSNRIKSVKVRFSAGRKLTAALAQAKFKKV